MGNKPTTANRRDAAPAMPKFQAFTKRYESLEEVQEELHRAGLESSNLILGIDFTASNTSSGKRTFDGRSLHAVNLPGGELNPYERVISVVGRTLAEFDDDNLIPAYGFGHKLENPSEPLLDFARGEPHPCVGFEAVLDKYRTIVRNVKFAGPTSFAPIIDKAVEIVRTERAYHILVIIADGQVTPDNDFCTPYSDTVRSIVAASKYPLSIVVVGVGDGPWEQMNEMDEGMPTRVFDNLHFVDFHSVWDSEPGSDAMKDASFAVAALQEIPSQFAFISAHMKI